jgi:hypothetical protein
MKSESEILSKLEKMKRTDAFEVPEGYFDTILPRVQDKIAAQQKTKTAGVFSSSPILKYSLITVSAVFIVVVGVNVFLNLKNSNASGLLNQAELAMYLEKEVLTIDEAMIADEIDEAPESGSLQNDNDMKYLIDNNIESTDILTEL